MKKESNSTSRPAFGAGVDDSSVSPQQPASEPSAPEAAVDESPGQDEQRSPWPQEQSANQDTEAPRKSRRRREERDQPSRPERDHPVRKERDEPKRRERDQPARPERDQPRRPERDRSGAAPGSFASFELGDRIMRGVEAAGYTSPRPIQAAAIAETMEGRDILGLAQTGTGKTAAFVLPILHRLTTTKTRGSAPRVLIVAPTRELVSQIHGEVQALGQHTGVKSMTVFGGVSANPQLRNLRTKPEVIVACPGRLLDLEKQGALRLDHIEVLVLDEADHMFDMGFLPDVRRILSKLPKRRQNLLFSATMPREIRKLTKDVLHDPHVVELNHAAPVETIEHALYPVHTTRKESLLRHLIDGDDFRTAIVFTRTKHRAKNLARKLDRDGHHAVALQGNMSQPQRERAMAGFKSGKYDILVATDIAARGIDVAGVSHVVNFDVPNTPEAYMHRIGRTGRSEREGKAFTFVTGEDFDQVKAIEKKLGMEIPRVKLKEFAIRDKNSVGEQPRRGHGGGGFQRGGRAGGGSRPSRGPGGGSRPKGAGGRRRGGGGGAGRSR